MKRYRNGNIRYMAKFLLSTHNLWSILEVLWLVWAKFRKDEDLLEEVLMATTE